MTGLESLMWRLGQKDPRFRSTMTLAVLCDTPVERSTLQARLEHLCEQVPRLRERVAAGGLAMLPPRWEPDPDFALDRHLSVVEAPQGGREGLLGVAENVMAADFTSGRPPWRAVLAGDGVVLHLHHSYTDGVGGLRLVAELFEFERGAGPAARVGPAPHRAAPRLSVLAPARPPGFERLWEDLEGEAHRAVRLVGRAVPWAVRSVATARSRPAEVVDTTAGALSRLRSEMAAATGPASPLLRRRSPGIRLAGLVLPLDSLRFAGRRLGGGRVNDVFLAGLLGGLRAWHDKHGPVPPSLRLGIPMSARDSDGGAVMSNQLYGAVLRGPLGPLDFDETGRLVHEMVAAARSQPWQPVVQELADMALRWPGALTILAAALGSLDVLASNVPGPPVPLYLGSAAVTAMIPFGPRSGAAINATLLSYCDTAYVGINLDPLAVPDPGVLTDCLEAAFGEGLGGS